MNPTRIHSPAVRSNDTASSYYHGGVLHVRATETEPAKAVAGADLATASLRAESSVALSPEGPFERLASAASRNGALRDTLATTLDAPSLRGAARARTLILALAAGPIVMLLELDRELVIAHAMTISRLVMEVVLAAYVVYELTRRTPRLPGVAAVALAAMSLRFVAFAARPCGRGVHMLVYTGAVLAAAAAIAVLAKVPTRRRVVLELLDRLQITRSDAFAATAPKEPNGALVGFAIAAAAGLPALLYATRKVDASLELQAIVALVYAIALPFAARRVAREAVFRRPAGGPSPRAIAFGAFAGLALTFGLMSAGRDFFQSGTDIARCVGRLDAEARRAMEAQSSEVARSLARARSSALVLALTATVFPFAEERIYRGLALDVFVRKYGASYGVFASAVVFGIAHYGIYEVALYQTVLLGIGFAVAYLEGGLLAAFIVHATWNVALLL